MHTVTIIQDDRFPIKLTTVSAVNLFPKVDNRCASDYERSSHQDARPWCVLKEQVVDDLKCNEQ